jgi:tetratricopeptide (TPR) repeat protein
MQDDAIEERTLVGSVVSIPSFANEKFVVGRILHGGMGTVYQLVPVRPRAQIIALKTFQRTDDEAAFEREARVWISLSGHPHIAQAIWYGCWQGQPAVIAKWYPQSLADGSFRHLAPDRAQEFVVRMISGLQYAVSSANLIHQDIKPQNVMIDEAGAPRISDFGLARLASDKSRRSKEPTTLGLMLTALQHSPDAVGGTPFYMAPELFGGARPSVQTDIFSLGVTLYQALTSEHPFCGHETGFRWRPNLRCGPLDGVFKCNRAAPLLRLITTALDLNPRRRPASYDDLLRASGIAQLRIDHVSTGSEQAIVSAKVLRDQGRLDEAATVLELALSKQPDDVALLNAKGNLLQATGRTKEAMEVYYAATRRLADAPHVHSNCDPVMNLARIMLGQRDYETAEYILTLASDWATDVFTRYWYPEFGWLFLYRGDFAKACDHLVTVFKAKAGDTYAIAWFTLAAVLSETAARWERYITQQLLSEERLSLELALCACLIAGWVAEGERHALYTKAEADAGAELRRIASELGVSLSAFRPPISPEMIAVITRSLDYALTGGKFCGTSRRSL